MSRNTLSITDHRTGRQYEIAITEETIRAMDLRQIKESADDFGLLTYDPGYMNTACCRSRITFIDGDRGILLYRGYPIDQLAEQRTHLQVVQLILNGELPDAAADRSWSSDLMREAHLPAAIPGIIRAFDRDAHPMGMVAAAVAALSTCYSEAGRVDDAASRRTQIRRLIAQAPTIAAYVYRHKMSLPFVAPNPGLSYAGNFLHMMFSGTTPDYRPHPVLERALDVLFILHADHEQNCSTSVMRSIGSARTDPYLAAAGAIAALAGPLHGGANEAVLAMLQEIGNAAAIPEHVRRFKSGQGRLMGFGHRVYKNYDPRARIIKRMAEQVLAVTGSTPLLETAMELETVALQDDYFVSRKLYPNVDFYSGLIYQAMGFPTSMFTVLFAIGRTAGWLAQWEELILDAEQKIARPRQIYQGPTARDVPERLE